MVCLERSALFATYEERARAYSAAVASLRTAATSVSGDAFMKRWECAEFAKDACTLARIQVWSHIADHGCLLDNDPRTDRMAA